MIKVYFSEEKGIALIDGKKISSPALTNEKFTVEYFPYDSDFLPVQHAVCKSGSCGDMLAIKHEGGLILKFSPEKKPVYEEVYIRKQTECGKTTHLLTCKADKSHVLILETREEIITLPLPARADDVVFKAKSFCDGQLIIVKAKTNNKTFMAVLHYKDDYSLIMRAYCDSADLDDDGGIILKDKLYDCMQRACVRKLKFCSDSFREESRYFEYGCDRVFPDEIIPYVFLESLSCRDDDFADSLLAASVQAENLKTLLGDFVAICDAVPYTPYRVTLVYADNGFYTKTFYFSVSGGRINFVNCL